jgi:hypothetical protein
MATRRRKRTTATKRKAPGRRRSAAQRTYWSGRVTKTSNALDLRAKVFTSRDPHRIALSLKRSAESSKRRKGTPYQSAMSMLTFYINRAGKTLPARQKAVLNRAKQELRKAFGRA